jgi:hypothetical protein
MEQFKNILRENGFTPTEDDYNETRWSKPTQKDNIMLHAVLNHRFPLVNLFTTEKLHGVPRSAEDNFTFSFENGKPEIFQRIINSLDL